MRFPRCRFNLAASAAAVKYRSVIVLTRAGCRSHLLTGDQSRTALIGQVRPQPIDRDCHAVAKADQEVNVRQAPHQPGNAAGQREPAEIDDGFLAADRCEIAEVAITERPRGPGVGNARGDNAGDIGACLATGATPGSAPSGPST